MVVVRNSDKVSFFGRSQTGPEKTHGWTSQDIADLYRIADQLTQFGFPVSLQTGLSDEGDPWAVFERENTGEVVVHVARIGGELVIADVVRERIHRGRDFRSLADRLLAEAPLTLPRAEDRGNVVLHPRMVMIAFVAAAFVLSEFASPTAVEASELEADADTAPKTKIEQDLTASLHEAFDVDVLHKSSGRDGVGVISGGQATALAVSLYALSLHLVLDVAEDHLGNSANAEIKSASLFDKTHHTQFTPQLRPDSPLALNTQESGARFLVQDPSAQGEADLTDVMRFGVEDDDTGLVGISVSVTSQVQEAAIFKTGAVAVEDSLHKQVLSKVYVSERPDADPDIAAIATTGAQDINVSEVFSFVISSVIVMEMSWLPTFHFDGDVEGAIVVRASDLPDNVIDVDELSNNFPASLRETDLQLDDALPPNDRYLLVSELSQSINLAPDLNNILVYAGGDVMVSGFEFGRDRIVFIEDFTPSDWLASVNVVGMDVVLVGQCGSVTLFGAVETFV